MARIARVVATNIPHHVTQRGNRRQKTFFQDEDYRWSSASAHPSGEDDTLVKVAPLLVMVDDWEEVLAAEVEEQRLREIRKHECTGRPLGSMSFVERLESTLGRSLQRQKPGPKKEKGN